MQMTKKTNQENKPLLTLGAFLGPLLLESINLISGMCFKWYNSTLTAFGFLAAFVFGLVCFILRFFRPARGLLWALLYAPMCFLTLLFWALAFDRTIGLSK